jgi:hypothetical protein
MLRLVRVFQFPYIKTPPRFVQCKKGNPMRSLADPEVPNDFREYLPFAPLKDTGGPVLAFNTDEQSVLKSKIEDLNDPPPVADSPEGVGRIVVLPAGRLTTGELELSQMQSLRGVKGSTILTLKSDATISNRGDDTGAYITIKDDLYVVHGIAGQGVIEDLDIDAIGTRDVASGPANIHGLYAPLRETEQDLHTIRNVAVYNAQTNGIHFDVKNNKLVCDRLRSENSLGVGIYLAGGDQPFAYLNVDAYYGTWTAQLIDDENFTMPDLPALSENSVPAIRAVP